MFQRLLICTDFSDGVHRLVHFVPSLAATGLKQITFLHGVPLHEGGSVPRVDTAKVTKARQQLEAALQNVPTGVEVEVKVESGRPLDLILETVRTQQADLILLGMPTRTLLTEKLFGSTTIGLCQRAPVPLMIIRPQLISTYTSEELDLRCRHLFRYLLVPYDGSDTAKSLIARIKELAVKKTDHSPERCHLCWAVEAVGRRDVPRDYQIQAARDALTGIKAELEAVNLTADPVEVRQGDPVVEVLEAAQMGDISAIATSSDSIGKLMEWSIPSFTGELLRRSWHPILYFPPKK